MKKLDEGLIEILSFDLRLEWSELNAVAVSKRYVMTITTFYRHDFGRLRNMSFDMIDYVF